MEHHYSEGQVGKRPVWSKVAKLNWDRLIVLNVGPAGKGLQVGS